MKKLFLVSFGFVCITVVVFAQSSAKNSSNRFSIGVLGGLNIPNLQGDKNNEMSRDYTSRSGAAFGLTTSYSLSSDFSIRVDALYSSEGGKRNGIQAIDASSFNPQAPVGTFLYANFKNETILNYFEIPVMLKYTVPTRSSTKFYINFGPYLGYLLNAKQKTSGSSLIYQDRAETIPIPDLPAQSFDATVTTTSSINRINFGLTGGVGLKQKIGFGDLILDVRGAYGLTVVQKNSQDGSSHTGNLLIALGYSIHF